MASCNCMGPPGRCACALRAMNAMMVRYKPMWIWPMPGDYKIEFGEVQDLNNFDPYVWTDPFEAKEPA